MLTSGAEVRNNHSWVVGRLFRYQLVMWLALEDGYREITYEAIRTPPGRTEGPSGSWGMNRKGGRTVSRLRNGLWHTPAELLVTFDLSIPKNGGDGNTRREWVRWLKVSAQACGWEMDGVIYEQQVVGDEGV